ncbi:hypothetical protein [Vibrio sp. SCSIO 43086]|uniref:hypothetical protein n=1 Tax=Vibrio sp. SCSIO 43086 TaxID=2822845 RepID=UPI001DFD783A|nr:hypothetical protein [Vibrio alginolyticus]
MKKNIKIKTNSFRLSFTLKVSFNLLNNKEFLLKKHRMGGRHAKVIRPKKRKAFTLACLPAYVK